MENEVELIETLHIKWYGLYSLNVFYSREEAFKKVINKEILLYIEKNKSALYKR